MTTYAKILGGASLQWVAPSFWPSDFWGQVDVVIPANTFTACGERGNTHLFDNTAEFIYFGLDSIIAKRITGSWFWFTDFGNTAASGPAAATPYTIKFHKYPAAGNHNVDWYVNGSLVATDVAVGNGNFKTLALSRFSEGCCCEIYYYTNVKLGTSDGGTDIFSDDFSGGLGNWTIIDGGPPASAVTTTTISSAPCPTMTVSPPRGQAGTNITINGTGFTPGSTVTLIWNTAAEFTTTADGSGNVSVTTTVPEGFGPGDWPLTLEDTDGNFGCGGDFTICGARPADGITTAPPTLVATGGTTDFANNVIDYIFHDGAHWILWQDPSSIENNGTFPPPANHALNATRISADGSSVVDYPIDTNYQWVFASGNVSDPGLANQRDCNGSLVSAPVWDSYFYFANWAKPIYDARFASDGTNLWVGVVTRETIPYPWLDNLDVCPPNPGAASQFVPLATLTLGFSTFATSAGAGYHRYNTQTDGPVNFYEPNAFPVTDSGEEDSGHWSPPIAVIFNFDGSSFNRIGDIPAFYAPGITTGVNYANSGIIGTPFQIHRAPHGSLFSRISLAASETDPGVCHAVWSEGGDWGRHGGGDATCGRLVWDGGPENRDYRVNYTTWDTIGKLTDNDIFTSHIDRTSWFFEWDWGTGGNIDTGYFWPDQAHFGGAVCHDLRNDNAAGTPYLFISAPILFPNAAAPGYSGIVPPPAPQDAHGNTWEDNTLLYGDTVYVYDLTGGTATLAQSIGAPLLPTEDECNLAYPPSNVNNHTPQASDALYGPREVTIVTGDPDDLVYQLEPVDKAFGISLPYEDPTAGNQKFYLVHVPWVRRFGNTLGPASYPAGAQMRAFYRVPTDMSGPFEMLDGERAFNFTVLKDLADPGFDSGDFFSDPKNIWIPSVSPPNPGSGLIGPGLWFDRVCSNVWIKLDNSEPYVPFVSGYYNDAACPGFYYDPAADSFSYAGLDPTTDGNFFAAFTLFICRGCRHCPCGVGIHLAHRF